MLTREQLQQIRDALEHWHEIETASGSVIDYTDELDILDAELALGAKNVDRAPHARDAVAWTPETGYVFAPDKNTSHAPAPQPIYMFRRKGLDDFCTCTKSRYDELSRKPHLFETKIAYTDPVPAPQREWVELEDDEVTEIADRCIDVFGLADLISEALRAKNTGGI